MKRGWVLGVVLGVTLVASTAVFIAWQLQPRQPVEPTLVNFETFQADLPAIRIRGTAHYRGMIKQDVGASLLGGPDTYWVYPLFAVGDTEGREVRLLVRSPIAPPKRVEYEFVELEGWLDAPRPHTIPLRTEDLLGTANYYFSPEVMVLEPWRQENFDPAE